MTTLFVWLAGLVVGVLGGWMARVVVTRAQYDDARDERLAQR